MCDVAYVVLLSKLEARVQADRLVWAALAPYQEAQDRPAPPDVDEAVAAFVGALDAPPSGADSDPDRRVILEALGVA